MFRQTKSWRILTVALIVLLVSLNFLNLRFVQSKTETTHSVSTYRAGTSLPDNMAPGFNLQLVVDGEDQLAQAVATALQAELEQNTAVASAIIASGPARQGAGPVLLVDLDSRRLWTPVYGRATVTALIFFADDGEAPWPLDEPVDLRVSPAVKADGHFTVDDTTWGLLGKPAYTEHLARSLAKAVAPALQGDTFRPA